MRALVSEMKINLYFFEVKKIWILKTIHVYVFLTLKICNLY